MCRWEEASFIMEKEERHISGDALRSSGRVLYLDWDAHMRMSTCPHCPDRHSRLSQAPGHHPRVRDRVNQRLEMILQQARYELHFVGASVYERLK
jgi:hypothetical protein